MATDRLKISPAGEGRPGLTGVRGCFVLARLCPASCSPHERVRVRWCRVAPMICPACHGLRHAVIRGRVILRSTYGTLTRLPAPTTRPSASTERAALLRSGPREAGNGIAGQHLVPLGRHPYPQPSQIPDDRSLTDVRFLVTNKLRSSSSAK
jgi:hypothetical protein